MPNGSLGHRYGDAGVGKLEPRARRRRPGALPAGHGEESVARPDAALRHPRRRRRRPAARGARAPDRRPPGHHRLRPAARPVRRRPAPTGSPAGEWPTATTGATTTRSRRTPRPGRRPSPACPAATAARIGREFAQNAEESRGRSMIVMGAGTNHWFHSDTIYRAFLTLTNLTGCQGVNGGGWAHYVGQEKVRPITGYTQIANALDWNRPPRNMIQTAYWYLHTNQFRYDPFGADTLSATTGKGQLAGQVHGRRDRPERADGLDAVVPHLQPQPARPQRRRGRRRASRWRSTSSSSSSRASCDFAGEDPDAPENYPRILSIWRANLLGSSGKGNEYFLKHLLGTDSSLRATETPGGAAARRREVARAGARGEARPADDDRLPADQHHDLLRRRPARRHLVREARPQHHRHASLRALLQPRHRAAVADPHRLGRLADDRGEVQRARRHPPGRPQGRRGRAADPRHPGCDGQPARRRPRLEEGRVRADPGSHHAQAGRGRARLRRGRREDERARPTRWTPSVRPPRASRSS